MFERKGLSDVVANVLIILLVLIAVSLVWFFLRGAIETGASRTSGAADCITLQIEPTLCTEGAGNVVTSVKVKRNIGSGDLTGLKFVFTRPSGSQVISVSNTLNELDEVTIPITGGPNDATEVGVAAVIGTGSSQSTCNPNPKTISCP